MSIKVCPYTGTTALLPIRPQPQPQTRPYPLEICICLLADDEAKPEVCNSQTLWDRVPLGLSEFCGDNKVVSVRLFITVISSLMLMSLAFAIFSAMF